MTALESPLFPYMDWAFEIHVKPDVMVCGFNVMAHLSAQIAAGEARMRGANWRRVKRVHRRALLKWKREHRR